MAGSIGACGVAERKYSQPPETGTLATVAPATWAPSTAYTRSPNLVRVNNGGNIYQCRTDGTSAASGGPTGTGADITDGTVHWSYIGAAYTNDVQAGSQILAITARGAESTASPAAPSDNDGGSYTVVELHAYASFPASVAAVYRRSTASNNKTAFAAQANWGGTSVGSGTGDELDIAWIEIRGVQVGAPHAQSHVERASSTANTVTAASITTTVPCLVVSYWFGNGNVITPGTSHTAIPLGGHTLIPGATCLMSLSGDGYIQEAVSWKIEATPGTFAPQWTTAGGEGAQLVTLAFALSEIAAVGTAAAVSAAAGVSASRAAAAGTTTATSTASGGGAALASSSGTATATATASGTGTALVSSTGTAECTSTAAGVTGSPSSAVGTAACSSSAAGLGHSLAAAAGIAEAACVSSGIGSSTGSGSVGTAACTSTAIGVSSALVAAVGTAACTSTAFSTSGLRAARRGYTSSGRILMATTLVVGDLEPDLLLQLTEPSSLGEGGLQAMDISDSLAVQLRIRRPDSTVVLRNATVESGSLGLVRYAWTSDDTAQQGQHRGHVIVTWSNGETQTVPSDGSAFLWYINPLLA